MYDFHHAAFDRSNSLVPEEFRYLVPFALKYGHVSDLEDAESFVERASPDDVEEFRRLWSLISGKHHHIAIESWLSKRGSTDAFVQRIDNVVTIMHKFAFAEDEGHGPCDPATLLHQWATVEPPFFLDLLTETIKSVGEDSAYNIALRHMHRVRAAQRPLVGFQLLREFRRESTLDWMEGFVGEMVTTDWGWLAAMSRLTSDRALRWLEGGRPLSLVALDALEACIVPGSNSPVIATHRPRIVGPFDPDSLIAALRAYQDSDPSPRVAKVVGSIIGYLRNPGVDPPPA